MKRKTDIYNKDRLMSQITKNTIKKEKKGKNRTKFTSENSSCLFYFLTL